MALLAHLQHKLGEHLKHVHDELPGVTLHQVVVSHDQDTIDRLGSWQQQLLVQPESIEKLVNTPTRNGDVVRVHRVTHVGGLVLYKQAESLTVKYYQKRNTK